ncbi:MAG TPA: hypothetical protein VGG83_26935 [Trebonia sp.]
MNMRPWNALTAAALIAGLAAGCSSSTPSSSSSPPPSSTGSGTAPATSRLGDAAALIIQCALTKGLMKPPTGLVTPAGETPWLKGTKVEITAANAPTFSGWYNDVAGTKIAGEEVGEWVQQTADSGELPAAVCGTSVTASALQKQVFAGDPSAGDPW